MELRAADRQRDAELIGEVLAKAFADDPVVLWLIPDGQGVARMFSTLAAHVHAQPTLAFQEGRAVACALWDPPGHQPTDEDQLAAVNGFVESMGDRIGHGMTLEETFAKHRPTEPHWYLAQVGTDPAAQGLGFGGALLKAGLAAVDTDGLPTYLESSKESNVPLYEKYGFAVTSEITLPDGPTVYGMWRPGLS